MTSRERIRTVLAGMEPDRVPIDFGGTETTGIHAIAYNRLQAHLGVGERRTRVFHVYMQLAKVEERIRARFSGDVERLSFEPKQWKPWTLADGSPCDVPARWNPIRQSDGSDMMPDKDGKPLLVRATHAAWFSPRGPICPQLQAVEDIPKHGPLLKLLDRSPWLDESLEDLVVRAKRIRSETHCAIAGVFGGHIFAQAQLIRGMDNFMCDLLANETLARALMDTLAESHMADFQEYVEALGPYLDVITVADDLGMQHGPQIAPDVFRRVVKPYLGKLYGFMKSRMKGAKLFLHSCGSVYDLIPDLIEMGVDILNPVQVSAANMDSKKLKAEFGKDLVFWGGGCDTQSVLSAGSVSDVRAEVKRRIDDFGPGGGFVFSQVHNIQPDVPPENIEAMFDAALEFGG